MKKTNFFSEKSLETVPEGNSETEAAMLKVFTAHAGKYFTQRMFVEGLERSNPYINKLLRRLVKAEKLKRVTRGRVHYYSLK